MGLLKIMSRDKTDAYAQIGVEAMPSKVEEKVAKVEAKAAGEVQARAEYLNRYRQVKRGDLKVSLLAEDSVGLAARAEKADVLAAFVLEMTQSYVSYVKVQ